MKTSITIALAFAMALSVPCAYAQTEQPNVHRHTHHHAPHHTVHHHTVAHGPGTAPAPMVTAPAPQPGAFGLALPHIAPYPNNKGDEDGLSEDPDNCNKGCIDGNGAD